ncbi:type I restriction enzyme endonuclease domain-containing protein, partial [Salmonella enterica]|uniref:type I restriction enzyme endonuclease domain-containing protein n=1 Tax=Salmonella enterica TaxID=28901 RepID=UPI001F471A94
MEQKNLSIELLNKLLNDEVKAVSRYNVVKWQEFSEKLKTIMKRYHEGLVESAGSLDQFTGLVKEDADEYSYTSNKAVSPEDIRQALM